MKKKVTAKATAVAVTATETSARNSQNSQDSLMSDCLPRLTRLRSAKSVYDASKKLKTKPTFKTKAPQKKTKTKLKKQSATRTGKKSTTKDVKSEIKTVSSADASLNLDLNHETFVDIGDSTGDDPADLSHSSSSCADGSDVHAREVEETRNLEPLEEFEMTHADGASKQEVDYQTLESFDFLLVNPTAALAFVPFHTCFYFKGRLNVTILSGTTEVLGYTMDEDPARTYKIYSPRGYSLTCIRSVGKNGDKLHRSVQPLLKSHGLDCDESMLKQKSTENVLLLLQSLNFGMVDYLSRLFTINILRREDCLPPAWEDAERCSQLNQLCARLDTSVILRGAVFNARFYQQPDVWSEYAQQLIDKAEAKKEPVRLMLCGRKGVGKSTLLRYLANRLIKRFGSVLVIDFDPGQPEFFPSGCVSASLVSEPLLGPNFTHFQQPLHSYFIGDTDITACPDRYMNSCRRLLLDCRIRTQLTPVPVLLNTMGFTVGVGLDVMLDLIRLSQPLQVIQLCSRSPRRNFAALLERDYVIQHPRGWSTSPSPESSSLPDYSLEAFLSAAESSEKSVEEWGFRASELRQIGLASYFSRLSTSPEWSLTDAAPYRISWSQLAICICHESIPPELTMAALNASLVALCVLDADTAASVPRYRAVDGQYPVILREMPLMPCLGYGVVRGIDTVRGYVYLITPESSDLLAQVNCLVMGAVQLPGSALLDAPLSLRHHHGKEKGFKVRIPYGTFGPSATQPACRPYRKYNPVFSLRNLQT